jgi:hypothetical protein
MPLTESDLPTEIAKVLKNGVELKWQELTVIISSALFKDTCEIIATKKAMMYEADIFEFAETLRKTVTENYKKIESGKFKQSLMDDFVLDLCILHVLAN